MTAKVLMVQGTASSVGKSLLVAALCRLLARRGYRVAPFKAQNMALNSAVTPDGLEIGRSTAVQAEAAGVEPAVEMNPILIKPEAGSRAQVVLLGRPAGALPSQEYAHRLPTLWGAVTSSLDKLRAVYDVVVIEGAGSPAEINLRDGDIVNMRVALYAQAPVLLVGDIDRGGVFASLVGTLALLEPEERALVQGFVINRFRGDVALLEPGLRTLQDLTGVPVLGVVPYLHGLRIAEEDAVALERPITTGDGPLDIAVVHLPHISNFDDFDLLGAEPAVRLRYVGEAAALARPDLLILPGTKATMADLSFLRATGLAERILALARAGTPILGICGGYQMLGRRIQDPDRVESAEAEVAGLNLLPVQTRFLGEKRTRQVRARTATNDGPFASLGQEVVSGYEIHMGVTESAGTPLFRVQAKGEEEHPDGCLGAGGQIAGTYLHGLFESTSARRALLEWLAGRRGVQLQVASTLSRQAEYDRLADCVEEHIDVAAVWRLAGLETR